MTGISRMRKGGSPALPQEAADSSLETSTNWYTSIWMVAAIGLFLAFQAYSPSMRGPFLFDDLTLPFSSPHLIGQPLSTWISGVRPVLMMTYWMNYEPSSSSTFNYHLTNLLIHACNALLVFAICRRLFRRITTDSQRLFVASAFSCALFLLHPLQTQSVAYVAGRSEVLSATFVLSAWLIYVRRIGRPVSGRESLLLLLLFGLAAATKEQAVATLPAIFLLTDWTVRRESMSSELFANRRLYIPLGLSAVVGAIVVGAILVSAPSAGFSKGVTSLEYLLTECRALLLYLRLFILPVGQNADHHFPISHNLFDYGAGLAACALVVGVLLLLRQPPLVRYGGLLFLAFLAPTSSVVPLADPFSEHRMYLPIVGLAIAVSATLIQVSVSTRRIALACAACSVLAFFATAQRTSVWSSGVLFWQDVVAKSPRKARGYQHLTHSYVAANRCDEAIRQLEGARGVMPRDYFTLVNWAQAYTCANRMDAALEKLREAEQVLPTADVYGLIGDLLMKQGRSTEAEEAFTQALAKEKPATELAHVYRGNLALLANDRIRAEQEYRQALEINPYSPEAVSQMRRLHARTDPEERSRSGPASPANAWPMRLPGQFVDKRLP